jgi:hypothetical protein
LGSELVAQKIKVDDRVVAAPVHILAVDEGREVGTVPVEDDKK